MSTFNESEHPRATTGQFAEKGLAAPGSATLDVEPVIEPKTMRVHRQEWGGAGDYAVDTGDVVEVELADMFAHLSTAERARLRDAVAERGDVDAIFENASDLGFAPTGWGPFRIDGFDEHEIVDWIDALPEPKPLTTYEDRQVLRDRADAIIADTVARMNALAGSSDEFSRELAGTIADQLEAATQQMWVARETADFRLGVFDNPEFDEVQKVELETWVDEDGASVWVSSARDADGNQVDDGTLSYLREVVSDRAMFATSARNGQASNEFVIERTPKPETA